MQPLVDRMRPCRRRFISLDETAEGSILRSISAGAALAGPTVQQFKMLRAKPVIHKSSLNFTGWQNRA